MPDTHIPGEDHSGDRPRALLPRRAGRAGGHRGELRHVCETVGFLFIVNHCVPALVDATFAMAARFHAQPLEAKTAGKDDAMQGYLPYAAARRRAQRPVAGSKPNENEAFFVNPERDAGGRPTAGRRLPGFRPTTMAYFAAVDALALRLLPLYASALDLPAGYFAPLCDQPLTSLRLTHYPPVEYGADEYGIAPHTNSSFFTLLAQNTVPGLQIRTHGRRLDRRAGYPRQLRGQYRRRAEPLDQRPFPVDAAPRLQPVGRPALRHPVLLPPQPGHADRRACRAAPMPRKPPRFPAKTIGEYMAWFRGRTTTMSAAGGSGDPAVAAVEAHPGPRAPIKRPRRPVRLRTHALASSAAGRWLALPPRAAEQPPLRVSLNTELQVLDPIVTTINATRVFAYMVFDTLVGIDNEGKYHPQMLEGWKVSDDRLTYSFTLRDGLEWSDGTPVTAEDCVASIQRWAKREAFGKPLMAATKDLRVIDAKTFELQLSSPFAFVIEALGKPGNTIPVMMPARLAASRPGKGGAGGRRLRAVHLPPG